MLCKGPEWIINIFQWLEQNLITQEIADKAMNWLYAQSIIVCNEMV